jgi:hypothetical protein
MRRSEVFMSRKWVALLYEKETGLARLIIESMERSLSRLFGVSV